ncbi:MAG TPA: CsbD family protein [Alphaproteobacteria bacterium]|nr:CsbD family protein [Alphaproteobacteria bacterium]
MDKDRVKGVGKEIKGSAEIAAGKLTGDAKLKAEGHVDKAVGKLQGAVGKAKDELRKH